MPYTTIQPPFTLEMTEMSRQELRAYFEWFMSVMPERIEELHKAVNESPEFERWSADGSPSSLDSLGRWFAGQVESRDRTQEEMDEIRSHLTFPIDVPTKDLTNRTFSLAMDIGMYFAHVMRKNHHSLEWQQPFGSKRFADYGQPVLAGFGVVALNPVRVTTVIARGLVHGTDQGDALRKLYNTWSGMVTTVS